MRSHLASALICVIAGFVPCPLEAQTTSPGGEWTRTKVEVPPGVELGAKDVLDRRPPAATFADLKTILKPGYEVVVVGAADRRTRGRVLSVSDGSLVLVRQRLFHAE